MSLNPGDLVDDEYDETDDHKKSKDDGNDHYDDYHRCVYNNKHSHSKEFLYQSYLTLNPVAQMLSRTKRLVTLMMFAYK